MPFKEGSRKFWMASAGNTCQWETYTEKYGFKSCGKPAKHVHHIEPESVQLETGKDPEHSVGMPLCENHHVRNLGDEIFEEESSMHPDMGQAYQHYKEWKANEQHMMSITGRKTIDYSTSPFADASREHKVLFSRGERFTTGTDETDKYYTEKMTEKAVVYIVKTGEKKPDTKEHPKTDRKKRKAWYDGLY